MVFFETTRGMVASPITEDLLVYAEAITNGRTAHACRIAARLFDPPVQDIGTESHPFPEVPGKQLEVYTTAEPQTDEVAAYDRDSPHFVETAAHTYAELRVGQTWLQLTESHSRDAETIERYERHLAAFRAFTASRHVGRAAVASDGHFVACAPNGHIVYGFGHTGRYGSILQQYLQQSGFRSAERGDVLFPFELALPHLTDASAELEERMRTAMQYGRIGEVCAAKAAILDLKQIDPTDIPAEKVVWASQSDDPEFSSRWCGNSDYGSTLVRQHTLDEMGIAEEDFLHGTRMPIRFDDELAALMQFKEYYERLHVYRAEFASKIVGTAAVDAETRNATIYTPDGDCATAISCDVPAMRRYLRERNYDLRSRSAQ